MSLDNAGQCARRQWKSGVSLKLFVGESPGLSAQGRGPLRGSNTRRRTRRARAPARPLPWLGSGQGTHGSDWWRAQFGPPARIREWAAQELTTGRLLPWFIAYGAGVILYFTAEREPALWAAAVPAAACALGAALLRRQIVPQRGAVSL